MRSDALFFFFGLFVGVYGASLNDLISALNTTDAIWLYNQSYYDNPEAPNRTCVYWHLKNLTTSSYLFDNDYKQNGTYETEYNTTATLSQDSGNAMMTIFYKSEGKDSTNVSYKLNMWDPKDHCFILTRINEKTEKDRCELHLWQEQLLKLLKGGQTSCVQKYKDLCGEQGPEVFSEHECM
uniref:Lipocalin n=1 Tax=Rhipicephalus appendiculatus TaxID=34631 RepID=A0A131YQA0_RHIAP